MADTTETNWLLAAVQPVQYGSTRLTRFNYLAFTVHLVLAVLMVVLVEMEGDILLPLTHTLILAVNTSVEMLQEGDVGAESRWGNEVRVVHRLEKSTIPDLSLGYMITWFFVLSFFFQYMYKLSFSRYIEYTFSGSLMAVIIAMEAGQADVYAIWAVFTLHATCMLCGALADELHYQERHKNRKRENLFQYGYQPVNATNDDGDDTDTNKTAAGGAVPTTRAGWGRQAYTIDMSKVHPKFFAFGVGWVPFLAAWVIIFGSLATAMENNPKMPDWISGVVLGEFAMFIGFGITQGLHLGEVITDTRAHALFILQSLTSKVVLAAVVATFLFL